MATEVRLPQLGKTMEQGTIIKCLVKVGDKVSGGDILFELETDKATMEMESPKSGFVKAILVEPGQTINIHETLLIIGGQDEQISQQYIDSVKLKSKAADNTDMPAKLSTANISNEQIVSAVADSNIPEQIKLGQTVPLSRLQKLTGQKMLQSKQQIPCFYLTACVDMTALVGYREKLNKQGGLKISYNDFIIRAAALALERFELMTGQLQGDAIKLADSIGVGLAVSVPGGLVAPVIKNANNKDVRQIAKDSATLIERAQSGKLSPQDLEGGCTTISNLGAFGVESFIPIVIPGQSSILGIGAITDTPVPDVGGEAGRMIIRKLMYITISVDHRVINGSYAGQYLDYVRKLLEDTSGFD
ncbi:MAG: dihydrolipoamide acetyltransferase family protein [Phycisphaerae bacterium]|jgi:pyruvate dehydrogenase E2 component (dihydrolipoamide acetyltransferase)